MQQLCLLTVHAHPDDEASKGAPTIARYRAEGVRSVLVTCTGGEEGDILNPDMDQPGVIERLPEIRRQELQAAADVIGYDEVVLLGYRDSGMPGSTANEHPDAFAMAPIEEAVGKLVGVIRRVKPQVIIGYPQEQSAYPHPDHIRAHDIAAAAFEAGGDAQRYLDAGEPWQPLKLYYDLWSSKRMLAMHEKFVELGLESPWGPEWLERITQGAKAAEAAGETTTTLIDVSGYSHIRDKALLAHATQVDPRSAHWFGLPPDVVEEVYPWDDYRLARNLTASESPEDDLFAGIRQLVKP